MRRTGLLVLLLVVVMLAGCRVDASVTVHVNANGSGVVTARAVLDADAVQSLEEGGAKLEGAVRLGDLTGAGWKTSGWKRSKAGGATLTLTKGFARAEDAGNVVAELNGGDGPVRGVQVRRHSSKFRTEWSFAGDADMKELKTGVGGDADLLAKLAAERVEVTALDQRLVAQTRDALRLRVTAELPNASARTFRVPPGTTVVMRTSSSETAWGRLLLVVLGFLFVTVAVVLVVIGASRGRRQRRQAARRVVRPAPRSVGLFDDLPE